MNFYDYWKDAMDINIGTSALYQKKWQEKKGVKDVMCDMIR